MVGRIFAREKFLGGEQLQYENGKGSTLNFADTFLTDCCANRARVSPNNELFIFCWNSSTNFESLFCMKTVKSRLFKKSLERRKLRVRFCLSLGWLHICEKKYIENCNSVGVETQDTGKVVRFWPILILILPILDREILKTIK